jgi:hypothetical protein
MTSLDHERDAAALELLLMLRVAREVIERAMADGLISQPLRVNGERSLLSCMDAAIKHGMRVLNPLPPAKGRPVNPPDVGRADAWRTKFEGTIP